jgi:hypothetical protein
MIHCLALQNHFGPSIDSHAYDEQRKLNIVCKINCSTKALYFVYSRYKHLGFQYKGKA